MTDNLEIKELSLRVKELESELEKERIKRLDFQIYLCKLLRSYNELELDKFMITGYVNVTKLVTNVDKFRELSNKIQLKIEKELGF